MDQIGYSSRNGGAVGFRREGTCTFERKSIPMVAWYMLSNESYMKRVINDVLPTAKAES